MLKLQNIQLFAGSRLLKINQIKMVGGGDTLLPSYINPDDLVEGVLEAVAQHRENTRQVLR